MLSVSTQLWILNMDILEFMTHTPKSSNIATSIFSVHIILAVFLYNWEFLVLSRNREDQTTLTCTLLNHELFFLSTSAIDFLTVSIFFFLLG
jgi:hypothetical protein